MAHALQRLTMAIPTMRSKELHAWSEGWWLTFWWDLMGLGVPNLLQHMNFQKEPLNSKKQRQVRKAEIPTEAEIQQPNEDAGIYIYQFIYIYSIYSSNILQ